REPNIVHRALARAVDVRREEVAALLVGFLYFFLLLCSYYMLRPLRDAMGLVGGARDFPWLFTATFVTMLAAGPLFGALVARLPPQKFVPLVYRLFALIILGFGALFASGLAELHVARSFFVWMSVFNLFVVSIFWSVLVDVFRSEQGRRLFGFIAAGGTAGALAGPALAALLVGPFGPGGLTLVSAALLEGGVQCVRALTNLPGAQHSAEHPGHEKVGGNAFAGLTLLLRSPYLFGIVLYMLLLTTTATFLYLEQARIVAENFPDTASRTRFFAGIDLAVNALTLLIQLTLTAAAIRRFGIPAVLSLLPLASAVALGALALVPAPAMLAALQATRRASDYALARPAREVLFTVVDREAKYKAKSAIETFIYR